MREQVITRQYLDELDANRKAVTELVADGMPLPRVVWRARSLYREAWLRERTRYESATDTD